VIAQVLFIKMQSIQFLYNCRRMYRLYMTSTKIDNTAGAYNEITNEESNAVSDGIAEYVKQLVRIVSR